MDQVAAKSKRDEYRIQSLLRHLLMSDPMLTAEKPNIVLLFTNNWAWNGSPIAMDDSMPNVERLAREGMKFTNANASPQCSPSGVCLQTGHLS
ncbi:hypothetical protein RE6C_00710 [Rhodopirellula europaea 6C]|uniref:Uncharacterized protein n=1 Tax=Rhodopirellula europaea 6C TaxID=1263867 RepID=M2B0X7_9BACT|nr:hypothetical protein RE6C_00710 [Rhodopirellula europaea 6C]